MIIANPLFDTSFKGLIKNEEAAKVLIGTLLGRKVLQVKSRDTERLKPLRKKDRRPACLRLGYAAVIEDENGKPQKLLVEVQKATGADTIMRFREYLALAGYHEQENKEESELPIITIYFLGFKLENVKTPCLRVARQYIDMLENKVLETKEKFVELLTHDSIIIQAPRINTKRKPKTELETVLSLFEQKNFAELNESTIDYKYPVEDSNIKKMLDILHYIGTDPKERKKLENEAYWNKHEERTAGALLKAQETVEKQAKEIRKKDYEIEKHAEALAQKDAEIEALKKQMETRSIENAGERFYKIGRRGGGDCRGGVR